MCFDGSCKTLPDNCPPAPRCGFGQHQGSPFLCPDGQCQPERVYCRTKEKCPPSTPVMCATGLCAASAERCPVLTSCPLGRVQCPDGSCQLAKELCPPEGVPPPRCPINVPKACVWPSSASAPLLNGCPRVRPRAMQHITALLRSGGPDVLPPPRGLWCSVSVATPPSSSRVASSLWTPRGWSRRGRGGVWHSGCPPSPPQPQPRCSSCCPLRTYPPLCGWPAPPALPLPLPRRQLHSAVLSCQLPRPQWLPLQRCLAVPRRQLHIPHIPVLQ